MRSTPSRYSEAISTRRLSLVDVSLTSSSPRVQETDTERKCFTPTPSLELNSKAWRQKITEEMLSVLTRKINNSIDFKTQQANFFDLMSFFVGLLYNRYNYKEFKDIDPSSFRENVASYIESHIPNLLHLNKSLSNIANSIIMLWDNPDIPLPPQNFFEKLFYGKSTYSAYTDIPKFDNNAKFIKKFIKKKNDETIINTIDIKRYILNNFRQSHHNERTASIILQIWDINKLDLNKAYCSNVNLQYKRIKNKVFTDVNFTNANFRYTHLFNVTFERCNMRGVCFDNSSMDSVVFNDSHLEGVSFDNSFMSSIVFDNSHLVGVSFNGTRFFNDTCVTLPIPNNLYDNFSSVTDRFFQHRNPDNKNKSILRTIDSIQDKYSCLKIKLMNQVINIIDHIYDESSIDYLADLSSSLLDVMVKPIYMEDLTIRDFVNNKLLLAKMRYINTILGNIDFNKDEVLLYIDYMIKNLNNRALDHSGKIIGHIMYSDLMYAFNNGINQMLYHAYKYAKEDSSIASAYNAFRNTLFNKFKIIKYYYDYISDGNEYYVFITNDKTKYVFLSHEDFDILTKEDNYPRLSLDRVMYSSIGMATKFLYLKDKADEVFDKIPTFKNSYVKYKNYIRSLNFTKYLSTLNLEEYEDYFIKAYRKQLTDPNNSKFDSIQELHATKLANIFGKFVEDGKNKIYSTMYNVVDIVITQNHIQDIVNIFNFNISNHEQVAKLLFCLSTVFANYSSWNYFGNDDDSPIAIRNYALALLNMAIKTHSEIFDNVRIKDFVYTFSGINRKTIYTKDNEDQLDTCTDTLSNMMRNYITDSKDETWNEILKTASPLGWYS